MQQLRSLSCTAAGYSEETEERENEYSVGMRFKTCCVFRLCIQSKEGALRFDVCVFPPTQNVGG